MVRNSAAGMVMHGPPSRRIANPHEREPPRLLSLAATVEDEATRSECGVASQRADRDLLEAKRLGRMAVLEIALLERLLDPRNAGPRAILGHEGHVAVIEREMAGQVATVPGIRRALQQRADLRLICSPAPAYVPLEIGRAHV